MSEIAVTTCTTSTSNVVFMEEIRLISLGRREPELKPWATYLTGSCGLADTRAVYDKEFE